MNLREYNSNHEEIDKEFSDTNSAQIIKFMGILWNKSSDTISILMPKPEQKNLTKQIALKTVSKVFDSLGILGPVVLKMKIFIQKLCKSKYDWDKNITGEIADKWQHILKYWDTEKIKISRQMSNIIESMEIYAFVDASGAAYATSIYLKTDYNINLVYAKNRLSPI